MASSSSLGSKNRWNHDVFLSFRGPDTRNTFTGHLCQAMGFKGINFFIDTELQRGEVITSQLLKVIEDSRISVIVLSEKYASSSFCLDELEKILESRQSKGQTVIPVFYHVDPTDVEEQRGTFGQEFAKLEAQLTKHLNYWKLFPSRVAGFLRYALTNVRLMWPTVDDLDDQRNNDEEATENMDKLQKWRLALTEIAGLSGWHLKKGDHEAHIIQDIVKNITKKLNYTPLHVAEHPIGLDSRVECILQNVNIESYNVCRIGLHGMGGVGKTTTAAALYNKCASQFEFEGSCFLSKVREGFKKDGGIAKLQRTLLSEILGDEVHIMESLKGIGLIKRRLRNRKVLIVFDDVDHIEQLQQLVGGLDWFGGGSIIIIATRDLRLLEYHKVTMIHEIKELAYDEALQLFSWYAFKEPQPDEGYTEFSSLVIRYAKGLPLALRVLGSTLYGRNIPEWKDVLRKLKRCPDDIIEVLRISYDGLDSEEKAVFLDIAYLLKGREKDEAIKFIDACGFGSNINVKRLIEKSLVYVDQDGRLEMHDLLEEMATQIDQTSHVCIRKPEDISTVFFKDKSANDVEILVLDLHGEEEEVSLKWIENLTKLKALIIRDGRFIEIPTKLSNNIRWLEWCNSCLTTLAYMPKAQQCKNLIHLNLSKSKDLREMMDFSSIPSLQVLNLEYCGKLKKIHNSVGSLRKLEKVELKGCSSLVSLPNLVKCQRLKFIKVDFCSKLELLPNLPISIISLNMTRSGIKEIPWFIKNLINLELIEASLCKILIRVSNSIYELPHLTLFTMIDCHLLELPEPESSIVSSYPNSKIGYASFKLYLSGNNFDSLPINAFKFTHITYLNLSNCKMLDQIPELPHTLQELAAKNCKSLARFSQFQFENDFKGNFVNCHKIVEDEKRSWREMVASMSPQRKEGYPGKWAYEIVIPGNEIPEWFGYAFDCEDNSFTLSTSLSNQNLIAFAFCVIFFEASSPYPWPSATLKILISKRDASFNSHFDLGYYCPLESEHMWLGFYTGFDLSDFLDDDEEISCKFDCTDPRRVIKRVGVHLIYKK